MPFSFFHGVHYQHLGENRRMHLTGMENQVKGDGGVSSCYSGFLNT